MSKNNHKSVLRKLRILRSVRWTLSMLGVALICWGIYEAFMVFTNHKTNEITNDAQIEQYLSPINVKVGGYVKNIYFSEHQFVNKGDTLLTLDDSEYRIKLMEAEAALMDAKAAKRVIETTAQTAQLNTNVYASSIEQAQVKIEKLKRDYQRYSNLLERNAATVMQVDQAKTELEAAERGLEVLER